MSADRAAQAPSPVLPDIPVLAAMCCLCGLVMLLGALCGTYWAKRMVARSADAFLVERIERDLARMLEVDDGEPLRLEDIDLRSLIPSDARQLQVINPALFREALLNSQEAREPDSGEASAAVLRPVVQFMFGDRLQRLLFELRLVLGGGGCLFGLALLLVLWRGRQASQCIMAGRWICAATWACIGALVVLRDWAWAMLTANVAGGIFLAAGALVLLVSFDVAFNGGRLTRRLIDLPWDF